MAEIQGRFLARRGGVSLAFRDLIERVVVIEFIYKRAVCMRENSDENNE